jgi:ABC-type transporter Mla MlaB component
VLGSVAAPSLTDHACAGYSTGVGHARLVTDWLVAGLELGQRCLYVGEGSADVVPAELPAVLALDAAVRSGAIVTASASDVYDLTAPVDSERRLADYAAALDQAVEDGYTGLRVVADMTALVTDPTRRPAHLCWEQYADRYMAEHPMAAMCLYDRRRVARLDAIECAHPLHGTRDHPFALYGLDAHAAALTGELDESVWEVVADVLAALPDRDERLDLTGLTFVDGGSAAILCDVLLCRRAAGRPLHVVGAAHPIRRVWDACGFDPTLLAA